jgi:5'-nucleotidase
LPGCLIDFDFVEKLMRHGMAAVKKTRISGLFFLSFLIFVCLVACAPVVKPTAQLNRITLIGTADLQGHLNADSRSVRITESGTKIKVAGGISRIATMIKQIKQNTQNPVIVLSSGDDLMGRYFHQFNGKAIYALMGISGYEVVALGNHEFDRGPGVLAEALADVDFTTLCSDLVVRDTVMADSCRPYLLKDYQGTRVGFFSLMTEDFPVITLAGKVAIKGGSAAAARDMVKTLKEQGAQLIIAVTHIGSAKDKQLAVEVQGIDIIFGGHSHDYLAQLARINNTLIVNGGEKGPALVRLDVAVDAQGRLIPSSADYTLIPVTGDIPPDPNVEGHLARYWQKLPATTVVGATDREWDLSKKALRSKESAVADLITDMIRSRFTVDVVLFNSGTFRGDSQYPPGPVTDTMLAEIDAFESTVFLMTMQGKYIRRILEHSATMRGRGGFLQGSGIRYVLDTFGRPQQLAGKDNTDYRITQTGSRVHDVKILAADGSWQPLEDEKQYSVATNDYLSGRGGDRYFWFKKYGHNLRNTYTTMGSIMTDYFRKHTVVNPTGPDGRIEIR